MLFEKNLSFSNDSDGTFATIGFCLAAAATPFAELKFKVVTDYGGSAVEYEHLTVHEKPNPAWDLENATFAWENFNPLRGDPRFNEDARDAALANILGAACRPLLGKCSPPLGPIVLVAKTEGNTAIEKRVELGVRKAA